MFEYNPNVYWMIIAFIFFLSLIFLTKSFLLIIKSLLLISIKIGLAFKAKIDSITAEQVKLCTATRSFF